MPLCAVSGVFVIGISVVAGEEEGVPCTVLLTVRPPSGPAFRTVRAYVRTGGEGTEGVLLQKRDRTPTPREARYRFLISCVDKHVSFFVVFMLYNLQELCLKIPV